MPPQALVLEWETVKGKISQDQIKHLEEIAQIAETRKEDWLYDLGFKQFPLDLSPSLDYFLRFSGCFVQASLKTAELEILREDAVIEVPPGLVGDFISACPLMAGSEYVTADMLEGMWQGFNETFAHDIKNFKESVSDYFREKNPDLHPSISNGAWLTSVLEKMTHPEQVDPVVVGRGFKATLRPYQSKGVDWLNFLASYGFGACLADDMTVQILAWLSTLPSSQKHPATLLVVPASLISNWESEINRFLPGLKVCVAHPGFTSSDSQSNKAKTTTEFKLTKTQLNRLSDLWSLFDFLNPGLLGNRKEFSNFAKTLKDNSNGYARLRQMIFPYILRRLKTDKNVIKDLPDKVEMKVFADLSPKQVLLYKKSIKDLKRTIETAEGIQRKGLVLSFLLRFKQLCNHPDQITGSGDFKAIHSGKFARLGSICETVYEKRERVLVFTQFKEMTEPLRPFLETIFHHPGLVLHGSVPVAKRKKLIQTFQDNAYCPFMVLSLKAGGVGLNLTRANHVVHFDRWWNPAVENQATDRAFRIGQTQKVLVHKFVTRGTIEEKIDRMISEKQALADQVVTSFAEGMITEMDDKNLLDLFQLSLPD